jgi:hypothetical protein
MGALSMASAAELSSFSITGAFSGVTITTGDGINFFVGMSSGGATFVLGSTTYIVTDILGFYQLADGPGVSATNADFHGVTNNPGASNTWEEDNSNSSPHHVVGWKAHPADPGNGIDPGETEHFNFGSITPLANITDTGLHVRVQGFFPGTTGPTGNIRFSTVPEPATLAVLAIGGLSLLRRRKRA